MAELSTADILVARRWYRLENRRYAGGKCHLMEVDCVTHALDWNIYKQLAVEDLWKTKVEKRVCLMSFYVRASNSKNGKFDAHQALGKGI
jgi:hypothetical protein